MFSHLNLTATLERRPDYLIVQTENEASEGLRHLANVTQLSAKVRICILILPRGLGVSPCAKNRRQSWGFKLPQQQTANRIHGVRKKTEPLTQFPGCLGDHRGGHPPAVWHLKLHPQNRLLSSRGGGGSPPDPPIKLAGSSHTSRQRECLSPGPTLSFKSSTAAAFTRPSVRILGHGMSGSSHLSSTLGWNANRGDGFLGNIRWELGGTLVCKLQLPASLRPLDKDRHPPKPGAALQIGVERQERGHLRQGDLEHGEGPPRGRGEGRSWLPEVQQPPPPGGEEHLSVDQTDF